MSNIKEFDIGDWILTDEGISQVLGRQKYVVEEFFKSEYPSLQIEGVLKAETLSVKW